MTVYFKTRTNIKFENLASKLNVNFRGLVFPDLSPEERKNYENVYDTCVNENRLLFRYKVLTGSDLYTIVNIWDCEDSYNAFAKLVDREKIFEVYKKNGYEVDFSCEAITHDSLAKIILEIKNSNIKHVIQLYNLKDHNLPFIKENQIK